MNNFYIDTHCHLDLFQNIQNRAVDENNLPIKTITVTNSPDFFTPNTILFSKLSNVRVALGLHPELVTEFHQKIALFSKMIDETRYIGEVGLDGSKSFESNFGLQKSVFSSILEIVKQKQNKILTVHSRNAADITIEMLNKHLKDTSNKVILHWFTGSQSDLNKAIDAGYYFSVNHKMAFSQNGIKLIAQIPIDRILTETDAPFTFDNKITNRLQSIKKCITSIAHIKKVDEVLIKQIIYANFKKIIT